jgi:hypothetical protein
VGKDPDDIRREIEETRARMGETVDALGYKADVKARARDSITDTKERVVESVTNVKDRVVGSIAGTAGSARDSVSGAAGSVSGAAGSVASSVGDAIPDGQQMRAGAQRAAGVAQENPLGLAIGAVAAGFLAGMLIPSTKVEDQRIGPFADQLKEKGQEAFQAGASKAQEAAQSAIGTVAVNATQDLAERAEDRFGTGES